MVKVADVDFAGYPCLHISTDHLSLWVTKEVGPRVIGLSLPGGENLLAVLPEAKSEYPGQETYYFRGGHRLWYGPEKPETTYLPDNQPVDIQKRHQGVIITQEVDRPTGIQKSWEIVFSDAEARIKIEHKLSNQGETDFSLAPWAITQIRPGGVGIFPQKTGPDDEHGLLPNRHLVLWPYTDVQSPYIHWGNRAIFVEARMTSGALKIGFPNPDGWLAYALEGTLFLKEAGFDPEAAYVDRGASSEVYCSSDFIELETMGPYRQLSPGETIHHVETWSLYAEGSWPDEIEEIYRGHAEK